MNQDILEGKWKRLKSEIKSRWADLTDDDLKAAESDNDRLIGIIQERYGQTKEDVKKQLDELRRRAS